ncbi:hypothetical protein [Streptomyces sp. NBC_01483]|uniref:hypothetical protein n=1 Tax=Streptomyces sp. NBC_01483 TaxID=2903883 RepID=UPI002E3764A6|nr:hypothetical protein [Streptomyces sp. NBC_01483]
MKTLVGAYAHGVDKRVTIEDVVPPAHYDTRGLTGFYIAFGPLVFTLALVAGAAAFTTKSLGTYLGPVGLPVATLVLLTVGNATSGATIGVDLPPTAA